MLLPCCDFEKKNYLNLQNLIFIIPKEKITVIFICIILLSQQGANTVSKKDFGSASAKLELSPRGFLPDRGAGSIHYSNSIYSASTMYSEKQRLEYHVRDRFLQCC